MENQTYRPDANRDHMVGLISGALATQVVRTLAQFGIADVLAGGTRTAADLARELGTDAEAMRRLMRAATALGLVTTDGAGTITGTELLAILRSDAPDSLRGWAIIMGAHGAWAPWGNMVESVKTGTPQCDATLGKPYWAYLESAPVELDAFATGMAGIGNAVSAYAAKAIDPGAATVAVDVGGGTGSLVGALLAAHPKLRGIVYDVPDVVPRAQAAIAQAGLSDRCTATAGDFRESVPEGDLYLLKWILHDWNDENCLAILRNCVRAMRPGGRVIALELLIGDAPDPGLSSLMDLNMMTITDGRERSTDEYARLFADAGLRLVHSQTVQAPLGPWNLLVAERA